MGGDSVLGIRIALHCIPFEAARAKHSCSLGQMSTYEGFTHAIPKGRVFSMTKTAWYQRL